MTGILKKLKRQRNSALRISAFLLSSILLVIPMTVYAAETENAVKQVGLEDYVEKVYNVNNGMASNEANTVLQDDDGYIWIGSYAGLGRYNGYEFINISQTREGAPQNGIRILFKDHMGRIWIGTNDSGLYYFQDETFFQITEAEAGITVDVTKLSVRAVKESKEGIIYIGTTDGLFAVDKEGKLYKVQVEELTGVTIENLLCDSRGYLWGTTANGQLFILKNEQLQLLLGRDYFGMNMWNGLLEAENGDFYVGMEGNALVRLKLRKTAEEYSKFAFDKEVLSIGNQTSINEIFQDSDGKVWVCTDKGTGYFDENDVFYEINNLTGDPIMTSMCEDYEGNLWFASSKSGLIEFAKSKFKNVGYESGILGQVVNSTVLYESRLYIGTDVGLAIMDETGKPVYDAMTKFLDGIRIRHLMTDSQGNLWVSTYEKYGVVCYNKTTGKLKCFTNQEGIPDNQTRMTLELANGDIAVATRGGLAIIRGEEITDIYTSDEGIQNEVILCMAELEEGILLAGSDGNGIYQIDLQNKSVSNITTSDGLQSGVILRMVSDEDMNGIWISNGVELAFFKDGEIKQIPSVKIGTGSVFDIKLNGDDVWLLKGMGMIKVSKKDLLAGNPVYDSFNRKDGLTSSITSNSWNYMTEDGMVFLCTGNGVYYINILDAYKNTAVPKVMVENITTDENIYYGIQDVVLPVDNKRITLYLDLLSFDFGGGTLEYYLEGFDKEPIRVDRSKNIITYTNLTGGDYTFHLVGYNADGTRSGELTFDIKKEKSVFEKGYFYFAMAALAIVVGLLGIVVYQYFHRRRILKRQKEYKEMTEQTIKMVAKTIDAKDKYTIGHSHRVAVLSVEIGRRYGLNEEQLEQLHYSALLHDIGKIGIPDNILKKNDKLTKEEYAIIMQHPTIGGEILSDFTLVPWISAGAKYHHERYDGTGYNEGIKGEDIPLYARIISVADSYDCMNTTRIYRPPMAEEEIIKELENGKGTQFDERFVDIMLEMIKEHFVAE